MNVGQHVGHRRAAILLLIFALVTRAGAEEGVLVLIVTDTGQHPFPNVRIGTAGDGGSPQTTDQNGKARLKLAPNTKPNTWVTLLIGNAPEGVDVVFISPYDSRVRVPPYDNEQENYDPVVLAKRGDKAMLESGSGMLAVHAAVNHSVATQRKKTIRPSSQNYRGNPVDFPSGPPHLQSASLRTSSSALSHGDPPPSDQELQQTALAATAQKFGLSVDDVRASILNWGGDALQWGEMTLTASIEAGGAYPFSFVRSANPDIQFGSGVWSLRECTLLPVLLQFQQRDRERFAEIIGVDTEWLSKTMSGPCKASAKAALQRMLDDSGRLSTPWSSRLRELGNEHSFQRVQVQQVARDVTAARNHASSLGLQSDQATAFLAAPAIRRVVSATPAFRERYLQDVAAFTRQFGLAPDEQEKLLILKNRTMESWQEQPGDSPETTSNFAALVSLFSTGSGIVSGKQYDLDDFGIEVISAQPVTESKSPVAIASASVHNPFDPAGEKQLVDLINQERAKQGIPPLQVDPRLTQSARKHTEIMVQHRALSHQFDGEPSMATRFSNENLPSSQEAENLALAPNVADEHESLMHSPPHRANILNPAFNAIGVGAIQSGGGLWVTQDFAHVLPEYSESRVDAVLQETIDHYAEAHGMPAPARKPQAQLHDIACDMAKNGAVNTDALMQMPEVNGTLVWRTNNPAELPAHARAWLSQPMPSGYSLGACSVSNGIYWVVMVTY